MAGGGFTAFADAVIADADAGRVLTTRGRRPYAAASVAVVGLMVVDGRVAAIDLIADAAKLGGIGRRRWAEVSEPDAGCRAPFGARAVH